MTQVRSAALLGVTDPTDMQAYRLARGARCAAAVRDGAPEGYVALGDWYALGGHDPAADDTMLAQGYEQALKYYGEAVVDDDEESTSVFDIARLWAPPQVDGALAAYFDVVHVGVDGGLSGIVESVMANPPTADAIDWMRRAAGEGIAGAAAWLADLGGYAGLVPPDMDARASALLPAVPPLPELDAWLQLAIGHGDTAAIGAHARRLLAGPGATEATRQEGRIALAQAADGGDVLSMLLVAADMLAGRGGSPAYAVPLLERAVAAPGGTPLNREWAATRLMECCRDGVGTARDAARAMHWRREAARLGGVGAMAALGATCMDANGPIPREEALEWLRRAADAGDGASMARLGFCCVVGLAGDVAQGVALLEKAAQAGSVLAMVTLGNLYASADAALGAVRGESPLAVDMAKADQYYRMAAEHGDVGAMVRHARCLRDGAGVAQDTAEALRWYEKAAAAGDLDGMLGAGQMYCDPKSGVADRAKGIDLLRQVAWGTDANARVAACELIGLHVHDADPAELYRWEDRAIELGDIQVALDAAQRILDTPAAGAAQRARGMALLEQVTAKGSGATDAQRGMALNLQVKYDEQGGSADPAQEAARRVSAAELGNVDAIFWLGEAYFIRDRAVPQAEALEWLRKSADLKNPVSMANLGFCEVIGMAGKVSRDIRTGLMLLDEAAKLDSGYAMRLLGDLHATKRVALGAVRGDSPPAVDMDKAAAAYAMGAAKGDVIAMVRHADCLRDGMGCERDVPAALQWYEKAAAKGNLDGMLGAGRICCDPSSGAADRARGIALFMQVAQGGGANALPATHELMELYRASSNPAELQFWQDRAIELGDLQVAFDVARQIIDALAVAPAPDAARRARAQALLKKVAADGSGADDALRGAAFNLLARCADNAAGGTIADDDEDPHSVEAGVEAGLALRVRAAGLGDPDALRWLGERYFKKDSSLPPAEALEWLKKGADAQVPDCMGRLGVCYILGVGGAVVVDVARGTGLLNTAATKFNHVPAMVTLADLYASDGEFSCGTVSGHSPLAVKMDKAAELYARAAGQDNVPPREAWVRMFAMARYADCLAEGAGVAQNRDAALQWYEKAANGGEVLGMLGVARLCGDEARSLEFYNRAAAKGNAEGELGAGQLYCVEGASPADRSRGIALLQKVALGDSSFALQASRALMRVHARDPDPTERYRWQDRAFALGDVDTGVAVARNLLGKRAPSATMRARAMSLLKKVVAKDSGANNAQRGAALDLLASSALGLYGDSDCDYGAGIDYLRAGAELGNGDCARKMGVLYAFPSYGLPADEALSWLMKGAEKKDSSLMTVLGWCYLVGPRRDLKVDLRKGERLLNEACQLGDDDAMLVLGELYEKKTVTFEELEGQSPFATDLKAAAEYYLMAAQKGSGEGMFNYGCFLEEGKGVEVSLSGALDWYGKAGAAGNVDGMMAAARLSPDKADALKWYEKAGAAGDVDGMMNAARLSPDKADALKWYEKAGTAGNVEAMLHAARLSPDFAASAAWYEKAGNRRNMQGMFGAGMTYAAMLPPDPATRDKAKKWLMRVAQSTDALALKAVQKLIELCRHDSDTNDLRRWENRAVELGNFSYAYQAAKQILDGDSPAPAEAARAVALLKQATAERSSLDPVERRAAFVLLVRCFEQGIGGPKDDAAALAACREAAGLGDCAAQKKLGLQVFENTSDVSLAEAIRWLKLAAASGDDPKVMSYLGMCCVIGVKDVLKPEVDEGLRLLEQAVKLGSVDAMNTLGCLYSWRSIRRGRVEGKIPFAPDPRKAAHFDAMAARGGNRQSMVRYADSLRDGNGVAHDTPEALEWYLKAVEMGSVEAMIAAGCLYVQETDPTVRERAVALFTQAAEAKVPDSARAMYELGKFRVGRQEWPDAISWLEKAVELGNADAMGLLASLALSNVVPGAPDKTRAIDLLRQGVAKGSVNAKRLYGKLMIDGKFCPLDVDGGVAMLTEPGVADHPDVQILLGDTERNRKNYVKASKWYGDVLTPTGEGKYDARAVLGLMLCWMNDPAVGDVPFNRCVGYMQDPERAERCINTKELLTPLAFVGDFFRAAAGRTYDGNPAATDMVKAYYLQAAQYYERAIAAGEDPQLRVYLRAYLGAGSLAEGRYRRIALEQYEQLAEKGDHGSMLILSYVYSAHTENPCADPDRMFKWTRRAADSGSEWALLRLAYCHALGIGVSQSETTALKIFEQLAKKKVGWGLFGEGMYYLYQHRALFFRNEKHGFDLLKAATKALPDMNRYVPFLNGLMSEDVDTVAFRKTIPDLGQSIRALPVKLDVVNPDTNVPLVLPILRGKAVDQMRLAHILPCTSAWMAQHMGKDKETCFCRILMPSVKVLETIS
ncbi:SEL1-like repeat protein [Novacetimonas maltaceti]|nr:SEL1-like repeat protein [Novacetimonas maltaceti]